MRNLRARPLLLTVLFLLSFAAAVPQISSAAPAEKQFANDLSYYRRSAKQKKMTANDRLYVLDQLRGKYKDAEFDLSDLYAEIDRCTALKEKEPKQAKTEPRPAESGPPSAAPGKKENASLIKAVVIDNKMFSQLTLYLSAVPEYKEILKKDERGINPPVVVLYLFNTRNQLKKIARDFKMKKGVIRQVQSASATSEPPTVRVSISLRADKPYTVKAEGNQLVLIVLKTASGTATSPEPLPAPAAALAPTVLPEAAAFEPGPPENAASQTASVPNETVLIPRAGDVLSIQVSPTKELSRQVLVEGDGTAPFHPVGTIQAQGIETEKIAQEITKKLSEYIPGAQVTVTAERPNPDLIHLIGQASFPGSYAYTGGSKCYDLISQSGGLLQDADKKHILIHRSVEGKLQAVEFDADAFAASPDPARDAPLAKGDIVEVRARPEFVLVLGAVKNPGQFPLVPGLKAKEALTAAGGLIENSAPGTLNLIRTEGSKKITRDVNVRQLMKEDPDENPLLKPGDVLLVPRAATPAEKSFMARKILPWVAFFGSLALVVGFLI